jgi:hypothetical protein
MRHFLLPAVGLLLAASAALAQDTSTPLNPPCNFIIRTTHRTIDTNAGWPGAAAQHGGYIQQPYVAPSVPRCAALGFNTMIVTMADGEGWCAYNGEQIVGLQRATCSGTCNYLIQTNYRSINCNAGWPGAAAQHGGYIQPQPYVGPSLPRCAALGYSTMIVTMTDGEGWCAINGEQIVSWQREPCYMYTTVY